MKKVLTDKKNIKRLFLVGILAVLVVVVLFVAFMFKDKTPEAVVDSGAPVNQVEFIFGNVALGANYEDVKSSVKVKDFGDNFIVLDGYKKIGDYDFLTTYLFKDKKLVAILNEAVLDGTQKYGLSIEFQKFSSYMGEHFTFDSKKEVWFGPELNYDSKTWSDEIINNNLELTSTLLSNDDMIKIIASGVNYFDYLAKDRSSISLGNLIMVYSTKDMISENIDSLLQ